MPRDLNQEIHKAAERLILEKGLPQSNEAERFVLASILRGDAEFDRIAGLDEKSFSTLANQRIFAAMQEIAKTEQPNRVSVAEHLNRLGQLESVGGLGYLVDLDSGMPAVRALDSYLKIIREKADLREIIRIASAVIDHAMAEGNSKDIAASMVDSVQKVQIGQGFNEGGRTPAGIVESFPGGISSFLDPSLRKKGLQTGLTRLDELLGGGLQDHELIIVAARPSCGKSALAMTIASNVVLRQEPARVDFFSLEMSGESLVSRMLCACARVDQQKFRSGYLNPQERGALQKSLFNITEAPLRIHDEFKRTLGGLLARIKRAIREGSRLIIIDYIQLMSTGTRSENRNLEIGEIGRALKLTTLDMGVPILLLSQIGRSAEKRPGGNGRPQLSDLKDSGTLEEHADTVITIFREELIKRDREDLRGLADLDILKQRNGPTGTAHVRFIHQFTKFENKLDDVADQSPAQDPEPTPPTEAYEGENW